MKNPEQWALINKVLIKVTLNKVTAGHFT